MSGDEGFLSRWSRRKVQVKQGEPLLPEPPAPVEAPLQVARVQPQLPPQPAEAAPQAPPLPSLEDVARLTRDSDYSSFMRPGVDNGVKQAAMKKLFADPHYNIMDGLDVYIGDYNTPDPLPASMLRQMVQAKALGLFDDEDEEDPAADAKLPRPEASPDGIAQPDAPPLRLEAHEDTDLQLQPDDAARREGAVGGADAEDSERRGDGAVG